LKCILVTPGEPAGIGPDCIISFAMRQSCVPFAVVADPDVLRTRAKLLQSTANIIPCTLDTLPTTHKANDLYCLPVTCPNAVVPGQLNPANAGYVLQCLELATDLCHQQKAAALVTGPINKQCINDAGIPFTGHTEWLADTTKTENVVMMLATPFSRMSSPKALNAEKARPVSHPRASGDPRVEKQLSLDPRLRGNDSQVLLLRVALVTTHLPLAEVPDAITPSRLDNVLTIVHRCLRDQYNITDPKLMILGLNPHAGDGGHLGREEIDVLSPAIARARASGIHVSDPQSADTAFVPQQLSQYDVVIAMYHDQGLPVLKSQGFW